MPPEPIEGQIVKTETVSAGGHIFTPVVFGAGNAQALHMLSQREARFIQKFLATGNLDFACQEIGVADSVGRKYLKRPAVKKYVEDMLTRAALAQGLTLNTLLAKLHQAIEGAIVLTDTQTDALKIAARVLKPASSVSINLQQNNIHAAPSPYADMSAEQLASEIRATLADLPGGQA